MVKADVSIYCELKHTVIMEGMWESPKEYGGAAERVSWKGFKIFKKHSFYVISIVLKYKKRNGCLEIYFVNL